MANRKKLDAEEKLIECAKAEFLEKGLDGTSLREIAARAQVSTYLIYQHFSGLAGLRNAIVAPAKKCIIDTYVQEMERFNETSPSAPYDEMMDYSGVACERVLNVIYENLDAFRLITAFPAETGYAEMIHDLVDIHIAQTDRYLEALGSTASSRISSEFRHIVTNSLFDSLFEVVRHDMPREDALVYYRQLLRYYMTGFRCFEI